jgi:hypothetical protein
LKQKLHVITIESCRWSASRQTQTTLGFQGDQITTKVYNTAIQLQYPPGTRKLTSYIPAKQVLISMRFHASILLSVLLILFSEHEATAFTPSLKPTKFQSSINHRLWALPGSTHDKNFVNDGPLAWMKPFLIAFGMTEGKSLNYAFPTVLDDKSSTTTDNEQAARLREEAGRNLMNIGLEERQRRGQAAQVSAVLTAVYAIWAALIADNGGIGGHIIRFGTVLPLFFTFGYKLSQEKGL